MQTQNVRLQREKIELANLETFKRTRTQSRYIAKNSIFLHNLRRTLKTNCLI